MLGKIVKHCSAFANQQKHYSASQFSRAHERVSRALLDGEAALLTVVSSLYFTLVCPEKKKKRERRMKSYFNNWPPPPVNHVSPVNLTMPQESITIVMRQFDQVETICVLSIMCL